MKLTKERAPAKLRMQELRDMNQAELMQEDKDKRYKDANEPKRVGGLMLNLEASVADFFIMYGTVEACPTCSSTHATHFPSLLI